MEAVAPKITQHCRERYVQRFSSDKNNYTHIDSCHEENCWTCQSMQYEIRRKVNFNFAGYNAEISNRLALADEERSFINNSSFMSDYYDKYGYEKFRFFWHEDVVFVVKDVDGWRVLLTCIPMERCVISTVRNRAKFTKREKKDSRPCRVSKKVKLAAARARSSSGRTGCWWEKEDQDAVMPEGSGRSRAAATNTERPTPPSRSYGK